MRHRWRRRLPRGAHLVDHGLVGCPVAGGDVRVDACFTCGRLDDVADDGAGTRPYVVCRGRAATTAIGVVPGLPVWPA